MRGLAKRNSIPTVLALFHWHAAFLDERSKSRIQAQTRTQDRWPILLWLGATLFVLLAASLLSHGTGRQVLVPWFEIPVPESCMTRLQFGVDCPGCGLTRSFIHILNGDISTAWRLNWVSLPIFVVVACQIPISLVHLYSDREPLKRVLGRINLFAFVTVAGLLVLRWFALLFSGQLI